jgi:hypothetical protein
MFGMRLIMSVLPFLNLNETGVCGNAVGFLDYRPARDEYVYASAAIGRSARFAYGIIHGGAAVGVNRPGGKSLGEVSRADNRATIVEDLDEIIFANAPGFRIIRVEAHDPVMVAVNGNSVFLDVVDPALLPVSACVKGVPGMGRDELQGVFAVEFGSVVTFPGRKVFGHHRPLRIVRVKALQTGANELELA